MRWTKGGWRKQRQGEKECEVCGGGSGGGDEEGVETAKVARYQLPLRRATTSSIRVEGLPWMGREAAGISLQRLQGERETWKRPGWSLSSGCWVRALLSPPRAGGLGYYGVISAVILGASWR